MLLMILNILLNKMKDSVQDAGGKPKFLHEIY